MTKTTMHWLAHFQIILLCIWLMCPPSSQAIKCDTCGKECASACGTKHFRTCTFASDPTPMHCVRARTGGSSTSYCCRGVPSSPRSCEKGATMAH
uniref:IP05628p n=1 Tax=Drosophila melanogaster TaxID=7227 RepID=Q4V689_DROME|nr:IP05628p [Drosophila melanogaster]